MRFSKTGQVVTGFICMGAPAMALVSSSTTSPQPAATRAREILQQRCYPCHGQNGRANKDVFVLDRDRLVREGILTPGREDTPLLKVIDTAVMPPGGIKLPVEEVRLLHEWVREGAPAPIPAEKNSPRAFLTESAIIDLISRDLQQTDPRSRPYVRYFSLAHLYNAGAPESELEQYRIGLSKLLNSLSWHPKIWNPRAVDPARTLYQVDLRRFHWSPDLWNTITAHYPYHIPTVGANPIARETLTSIPYVRADWFAANASIPPLYHQILGLPPTVEGLQARLGVRETEDLDQLREVVRGGTHTSGVAIHNRVLERHLSLFGAYWRSFDFRSDQGEQNIFRDPLNLKPAGGEFIFNLPNGMQAYFVANASGARLDAAPEEIVTDRNSPDQPRVVNGRSCMSCHSAGMNGFNDEVRGMVQAQPVTGFDPRKVLALYPEQPVLDQLLEEDRSRFRQALELAGGHPDVDFRREPVNALSRRFEADPSVAEAAAEVGLDAAEFQSRLRRSARLLQLGFGVLLVEDGGVKREVWENYFSDTVREMKPDLPAQTPTSPSGKG